MSLLGLLTSITSNGVFISLEYGIFTCILLVLCKELCTPLWNMYLETGKVKEIAPMDAIETIQVFLGACFLIFKGYLRPTDKSL